MKVPFEKYKIDGNTRFNIKSAKTSFNGNITKELGKDMLKKDKLILSELQEKLYASNTKSLLIIFQAMDAAGKDSAVKHVLSGLNPQGCMVQSFKTPNKLEYSHDFLWRHVIALPPKGMIGIHNRSHYENVLVCKVHPKFILSELPGKFKSEDAIDDKFWETRYKSIQHFEDHLEANGTVILKFFLHVSESEQKERLLARIDDPVKNWKFELNDLAERKLWPKYMKAYEAAINKTATLKNPWYVIPADQKWYARMVICKIIKHTLLDLGLKFPELDGVGKKDLSVAKSQLEKE